MDFLPPYLDATVDILIRLSQLLLEYLKVLAWPGVVLVLALVYRVPLVRILERLRKASGFGASLHLDRELERLADTQVAIEAEAEDLPDAPSEFPTEDASPNSGRALDDTPASDPLPKTDRQQDAASPDGAEYLSHPDSEGRLLSPAELRLNRRASDVQADDLERAWARRRWDKHVTDALGDFRLTNAPADGWTGPTSAEINRNRIDLAWIGLEAHTMAFAKRLGFPATDFRRAIQLLEEAGLIGIKTADVALRLRDISRDLMRDPELELNSLSAENFITTAYTVRDAVSAAEKRVARAQRDRVELAPQPADIVEAP